MSESKIPLDPRIPGRPADPNGFRGTVLIADDDPGIQDYYRKIFSVGEGSDFDLLGESESAAKAGPELDCRVFAGGDELVSWYFHELAQGRTCPLCILDMRMPGMNGLDAAQRLRAMDPALEIVLCTAFADVSLEQIRERLHTGFYYVRKPFARGEFYLLVQSLVLAWNRKIQLAEREERFRSVVRALGDGVILLDRNGSILEGNAPARHLLGLRVTRAEDVLDTIFLDEDGKPFLTSLEPFRKVFDAGDSLRDRVLGIGSADGGVRAWITVNAEPVWGEGDLRPHAVVLSVHDITVARERLVQLKDANLKLEIARREAEASAAEAIESKLAKSRFLANMSHEIRIPMTAILGLADALADGEMDPERHRLATLLRHSGSALLGTLNDILDHSRIEAGKLSLEAMEFDVRGLLEELAETFSVQARAKGLELVLSIDGDGGSFAIGDPGRIRQVVSNLVGNAVKFTSSGEVRLLAGLDDADEGGLSLSITVEDSGPGMDGQTLGSLFVPFVQGDPSIVRRFGGTGLGLSIAQDLAHLMGGTLTAESEPGVGSRFRFQVPLRPPPRLVAPSTPDPRTGLDGVRVLLADTRPTTREALALLVRRFGCLVEDVASFEELQTALRASGRWDALLVDRTVAGDDPAGWLDRLRTEFSAIPPCMLVTHLGVRGEAGEAARSGWCAYLTKPIRSRLVESALKLAVRGTIPAGNVVTRHSLEESFRKGLRVLVAEDHPVNQLLIEKILVGIGQIPTIVADGAQALAALERESFDLVLMDLQMPILDGLDATRRLRAGEAGERNRTIHVVALTGGTSTEERDQAVGAGVDDILAKPYVTADILRIVRRLQEDLDLGPEFGMS